MICSCRQAWYAANKCSEEKDRWWHSHTNSHTAISMDRVWSGDEMTTVSGERWLLAREDPFITLAQTFSFLTQNYRTSARRQLHKDRKVIHSCIDELISTRWDVQWWSSRRMKQREAHLGIWGAYLRMQENAIYQWITEKCLWWVITRHEWLQRWFLWCF